MQASDFHFVITAAVLKTSQFVVWYVALLVSVLIALNDISSLCNNTLFE